MRKMNLRMMDMGISFSEWLQRLKSSEARKDEVGGRENEEGKSPLEKKISLLDSFVEKAS